MRKSNTKMGLGTKSFRSVDEAAILLETTRSTAYRAISNGTFPLPVVRLGGRLRIPRAAVDRLLSGEYQPLADHYTLGTNSLKS